MDVVLEIEGGRTDELHIAELAVREKLEEQGVQVDLTAREVEQGALGGLEVLQFFGENLLLPVLVQMIYEYVTQRLEEPDGSDLKAYLVRTELPDGARRTEITLEGEAKDVSAILKELK
ncbi:hypothetical protein [Streptomonospora sp. PA3]|uniref:hypothetical protein n=1 Tax=Streptomonospora sp. PA3 TaxID=2607326 RepID=UPI00164278FB|nr:hypothetical protein [Streptomonospora sp. PA3]